MEGVLGTIETLDAAGIPFADRPELKEARKPAIIERKGTKVGFLNFCSVHLPEFAATDDRPGVSPIRVWTITKELISSPRHLLW